MNQVPKRPAARVRRRNSKRNLVPIFRISMLLLILAGIAGIGAFAYFYCASRVFHDTINAMALRTDTPARAFPGKSQINVLIMGRDEDRDNHNRVLHTTKGRTDAIMLAHIDFENRSANILSIPRDTLVSIPGYKRKRRINAANALGGPELAQATITDFLGVSPDYYMLTNFQGFAKAIDDIGGVTINVDKQLDYDDNWGQLHIHLKPGIQHLNGEQAMGFVRYRHSNKGGGDSDLVRIARQQALLTAVKSKIANPSILVRVPRVLDGIREDVDSNLTTSQMVCLARFMKSLPQGDSVHMETIPTAEGSRIYVKADLDATRELVGRMFRDSQQ